MFSTCRVIALIQALRDWESKGARLPEAVRIEVEEMEQTLLETVVILRRNEHGII